MPQNLRRVFCAVSGAAFVNGAATRPMKATFVRKAGDPVRAAHSLRPSFTWNSSTAAIPNPIAVADNYANMGISSTKSQEQTRPNFGCALHLFSEDDKCFFCFDC